MGFKKFATQMTIRIALLFATLLVLAYLVVETDLVVVAALVAAAVGLQIHFVVRFATRTNRELDRIFDAIRYDDFQQSFAIDQLGPTFADLKTTLDDVLGRFREARLDREAQRRYLEALVEHVPVALLAVHDDGTVELLNSAARRLLDAAGTITTERLLAYGATFHRDITQAHAGERTLTRMEADGVPRHLVVSTTRLTVSKLSLRLISLQDIQSELDGNELSAWRDMARILSHEILNSLTPISSLARTANDMVDELARRAGAEDELVADIHSAIQTVSRRSDGLMRFVRNYREFTQMPPPTLKPLVLREYIERLKTLFTSEWAGRGIELHVAVTNHITITADDALLDQAVINLLRNAADAAVSNTHPEVWIDARLSERGRPIIEIADNGPGLDEKLGDRIFLPFFTTKPDGSGIGLALARQVMLVHKGAITASARAGGGALFRLTF
jgi:two-component system, NtrC family, nitrogen regulation sensor histidine kinase NtrY